MWLDAIDLLFQRLKNGIPGLEGIDVLGNLQSISGACQQHGSVFWNHQVYNALQTVGQPFHPDPFSQFTNTDTSSNFSQNIENLDGKHLGIDNHQDQKATPVLKGGLAEIFSPALAWDLSPNWQDHSTETQCAAFENAVGGPEKLAELTGNSAHHRFTGPQILKLKQTQPDVYDKTVRISLVSSFLATIFADNDGKVVDLDLSDACGMNLWDIKTERWNDTLIKLVDEDSKQTTKNDMGLVEKLGNVYFPRTIEKNGPFHPFSNITRQENTAKPINKYFSSRYNVNPKCTICVPFTGDNPSTILSQALGPDDVMISLGTSTTALIVTPEYKTSPQYHVFAHPEDRGMYMYMLCYSNGALAREQVRDHLNDTEGNASNSWDRFNEIASEKLKNNIILGIESGKDMALQRAKVGIYFPIAEIIPPVQAQIRYFEWEQAGSNKSVERATANVYRSTKSQDTENWQLVAENEKQLEGSQKPQHTTQTNESTKADEWKHPEDDVMGILESQMMSIRYRLQPMLVGDKVRGQAESVKRPRRVFIVGGGSQNEVICQVVARVLNPKDGTFRLTGDEKADENHNSRNKPSVLTTDACGAGAAFKAVYETFLTTQEQITEARPDNKQDQSGVDGDAEKKSSDEVEKPEERINTQSRHEDAISTALKQGLVYRYCDFIDQQPRLVSKVKMPKETKTSVDSGSGSGDLYGKFIDLYAQSEKLIIH